MKQIFFAFIALSFLQIAACKHDEHVAQPANPPECILAKIEAFKQIAWAQSVIKISRPNDTLYWFVDEFADGGEAVLNENCEPICVADCECLPGSIVFCDETHFNFPMETIWEK